MNPAARRIALAGALLALTGVMLAALGSHAVDTHGQPGVLKMWETASFIHLFQAASLMALAALLSVRDSRLLHWGAWLIVAGTVVFCGSLYLRVITGLFIAALTPSGGLLMMAGWCLAALAVWRRS